MKEYKDFQAHNGLYEHNRRRGGYEQWKFKFDNGYGASVITGGIAYCNEVQPYELAVLEHDELCYNTPITDNVIGYLTSDEVYDLLDKIEQLQGVCIMSKSPCKNCDNRYVGCHSKCKPYTEYTQILVAYREAKEHKGDVIGYVKDNNIRIRRRANKPVRVWQ